MNTCLYTCADILSFYIYLRRVKYIYLQSIYTHTYIHTL